jgi:hypothetical protein
MPPATSQAQRPDAKDKKGFWGRIFGGSSSDKKDDNSKKLPASGPGTGRPQ